MEAPGPPRLLDQVGERSRVKHYSLRTEQAYVPWIRRFILFLHREVLASELRWLDGITREEIAAAAGRAQPRGGQGVAGAAGRRVLAAERSWSIAIHAKRRDIAAYCPEQGTVDDWP
jgi:hypothetical protein